ncbi:TPA: hypothetical protein QCO65_004984 [Bacillus cereus]|uniref:hypothetical protein n=1 Tax=Bacillus sp. FSL H8-0545 TaxID=2921402 RepID=UPI0030F74F6E|nr:hypothetical protein [Bacillus cereus]HDR7612783.1 hypothetical protein [Bacillus mycoides]
MAKTKEMAEVFRIGLQIGLFSKNEEINLAEDNIYGNLEDISQEIKEFLSIYKDFSMCFHLPYGVLNDE